MEIVGQLSDMQHAVAIDNPLGAVLILEEGRIVKDQVEVAAGPLTRRQVFSVIDIAFVLFIRNEADMELSAGIFDRRSP